MVRISGGEFIGSISIRKYNNSVFLITSSANPAIKWKDSKLKRKFYNLKEYFKYKILGVNFLSFYETRLLRYIANFQSLHQCKYV